MRPWPESGFEGPARFEIDDASQLSFGPLVAGNIENKTRVLTTAIVLETRKGAFDLAIALGIILLGLTFVANFFMLRLQGRTVDA